MNNLVFIQIAKDNEKHFEQFKGLLIPYIEELDRHHPDREATSRETIVEYARGMMNMQGPNDRHLELCYDGGKLVGFYYAKVDHIGHKGFIKPEYCYIMEFYVVPEYRRRGYGQAIYARILELFSDHNTKRMYLTADPVTGEPFWKSLGFEHYGEISPENNQQIFEKDIC
jgi:GNAT superfamily N-acetyltransferase